MNPRKLCFISSYPPLQKGEAEYSKMLISAMHSIIAKSDCEIWVCSPYSRKLESTQEPVDQLSCDKNLKVLKLYNLDSFIERSLGAFRIIKALIRIRPTVVHLQYGPTTDYGGFFGEPLILCGILIKLISAKFFITIHSIYTFDVIKSRVSRRVTRLFGVPVALYFICFMKILCTLANRILLLSSNSDPSLIERFALQYQIPKSKIVLTLHGCPPVKRITVAQRLATKEQLGMSGQKVILYFGFIRREKGIEYLIKAFQNILVNKKNLRLLIVGKCQSSLETSYLYYLKDLVDKLCMSEHVLFRDQYVSNDLLTKYLEAADVVVLPYIESVGASGPLHFTMSSGTPIIVSPVVSYDKKAKLDVVDPTNIDLFSMTLHRLITDDEIWREKSESVLSVAMERDWRKIAEDTLELYESV